MNQRETITALIEEYIKKFCPSDKNTLTALEIQKWPAVKEICENSNAANICAAMDKISIEHEVIEGVYQSTSYTIKF